MQNVNKDFETNSEMKNEVENLKDVVQGINPNLQYMKSIIMGLKTLLLGFLAFQIILMFMEWMKYMWWRFYMLYVCVMQVML